MNENKLDWKNAFWLALFVGIIIILLGDGYHQYVENKNLKSQVDSSLRKADSLKNAGSFEEAINEYQSVLKTISSQKFPAEYGHTQNGLGIAYSKLALDKESNLKKAINAFQEALKIYTVENHPIEYSGTQNNLGNAYEILAKVRDKESNLKQAINAFQEALKIYSEEKYLMYRTVKANLISAQNQL